MKLFGHVVAEVKNRIVSSLRTREQIEEGEAERSTGCLGEGEEQMDGESLGGGLYVA